MRPIILLVIYLTTQCSQAFSQDIKFPLDTATGKIKFSEVVYVDGAPKLSLYSKARE